MKKENGKRRHRLLLHDDSFLKKGFASLAGVDEAGRGPLAGPLVASAVIVRDFSFLNRIDDSKRLTPLLREKAYDEIVKKSWVGIAVISHEEIDAVNIFQATMLAMQRAVRGLPVRPDCILVDGNRAPALGAQAFPIVEGDARSFSIACASVVAKVTRDRLMRQYHEKFPQYGFYQHKGYGTPGHLQALKKHGPCEIHRKSFEPIKSEIRSTKHETNSKLK
ncbi:MAG: ribonuclease HII [Candidatus Omnitrophica bacterium]|nr:ribonuclease HII [Candidatus Omnitrophota bacterium]